MIPSAFEQNKRIGRCVNIVGYDPFWQDWNKARIQPKHFTLIKQAGFDSVRVNLHPFKYMTNKPAYQLQQDWLNKLDWVVHQALSNQLAIILDLHEYHAMSQAPAENLPRLLAFWQQIAIIYQDAPTQLMFEILNEPFDPLTPDLWNQFLKQVYHAIREIEQGKTIIIGSGNWNSIDHLDKLILPEDENIIATVHYYHPMPFTHQGASWSEYVNTVGIVWQGTEKEKHAIIEDFMVAQRWAETHKRPILLGEFGAYEKADMTSRVKYTHYVARLAEEMGWSWAYWQFDSDFIVYDIPNDRWIEPIRDALLPGK